MHEGVYRNISGMEQILNYESYYETVFWMKHRNGIGMTLVNLLLFNC